MSFAGLHETRIRKILPIALAHVIMSSCDVSQTLINEPNLLKEKKLLNCLNVQVITHLCQYFHHFSTQNSPCCSSTFSALRTCRSTIFAKEIASISGRKHRSDDKLHALRGNRVLNSCAHFSLDSSSHPTGPAATLLRQLRKTTSPE